MRRAIFKNWSGPFFIAVTGIVMLRASWGTWPDIVIDFGKEVYQAWQLTLGKTLYTDIAYYKGPLPPYLISLWFRWFGVGLRTLVFANLAVLFGVTALLYRL